MVSPCNQLHTLNIRTRHTSGAAHILHQWIVVRDMRDVMIGHALWVTRGFAHIGWAIRFVEKGVLHCDSPGRWLLVHARVLIVEYSRQGFFWWRWREGNFPTHTVLTNKRQFVFLLRKIFLFHHHLLNIIFRGQACFSSRTSWPYTPILLILYFATQFQTLILSRRASFFVGYLPTLPVLFCRAHPSPTLLYGKCSFVADPFLTTLPKRPGFFIFISRPSLDPVCNYPYYLSHRASFGPLAQSSSVLRPPSLHPCSTFCHSTSFAYKHPTPLPSRLAPFIADQPSSSFCSSPYYVTLYSSPNHISSVNQEDFNCFPNPIPRFSCALS